MCVGGHHNTAQVVKCHIHPFPQFFSMSLVKLFQFLGLMEQTDGRSQKRQSTIENTTMRNKTRKANENQLSNDGKGNIFISFRIESVKSNLSYKQKMKMYLNSSL